MLLQHVWLYAYITSYCYKNKNAALIKVFTTDHSGPWLCSFAELTLWSISGLFIKNRNFLQSKFMHRRLMTVRQLKKEKWVKNNLTQEEEVNAL